MFVGTDKSGHIVKKIYSRPERNSRPQTTIRYTSRPARRPIRQPRKPTRPRPQKFNPFGSASSILNQRFRY